MTHVTSVTGVSLDYDADTFVYVPAAAEQDTLFFHSPYNTGDGTDIFLSIAQTDQTKEAFLADTRWQDEADEADTFTDTVGGQPAQCRSYNTGTTADALDVIEYYVSYAGRGYVIRRVCTQEAEEGFGARMASLLDTLVFLDP